MNMQLDPHVKAVFDDIVAHTPDIGPTPSGDVVNLGPGPSNQGRRWLAVAAAAIVVIGVGALVAVQRPDSETPDVAPATQPPAPVADLAPGSPLVFDETPAALQNATFSAGNRFEPAASGELTGTTEVPELVRRWYTSDAARPELSAWIAVDSFSADQMSPDVPPDAEQITVQGVDGQIYATPVTTGMSLEFTVGETTYVLTAGHLTDGDLLLAAQNVRLADDGYGAVIDPAGLADGLIERGAGTMIETFFISRQALEHPIPQSHWDTADKNVWVSALSEDPALLPLQRLGYAAVSDTTVHGQPAYLTSLGDYQPEYRGVTWSENGITYLLGSNGFDDATIIEYANLLRPATSNEWEQFLDGSSQTASPSPTPTTMELDPAPIIQPGSVVCVSAGGSSRAMGLCVEELGGSVVDGTPSEDSYIAPIDPDNPQHVTATQHVGDSIGLPVRELDPQIVSTGTALGSEATTYLVIGSSDAPYGPPANAGQEAPTTVAGATGTRISSAEQAYTVVAGDTVESIAGQYGFPSSQLDLLVELNGWANASVTLSPGDIVRIPPGAIIPTDD